MYVNTGRFSPSNPLIKESIARNEFLLTGITLSKGTAELGI
jgi:hypothetical protein